MKKYHLNNTTKDGIKVVEHSENKKGQHIYLNRCKGDRVFKRDNLYFIVDNTSCGYYGPYVTIEKCDEDIERIERLESKE